MAPRDDDQAPRPRHRRRDLPPAHPPDVRHRRLSNSPTGHSMAESLSERSTGPRADVSGASDALESPARACVRPTSNRPARRAYGQPELPSRDYRGESVGGDLLEEVPGGEEVGEALAVVVAGQPDLAAVGGVQLGVVPAQLVDGGRLAAARRADVGPSGPSAGRSPELLVPLVRRHQVGALDAGAGGVGHHDGDVGQDERRHDQHPAQPAVGDARRR